MSNIQIRAAEYLPANLECGVFLIPSRTLPDGSRDPGLRLRPRRRCGGEDLQDDVPIGIGIGLI